MDTAESWLRFSHALRYYAKRGFTYVDVPWATSRDMMMVTCPDEKFIVTSDVGDLVGSAEQSLVAESLAGRLAPGRYMAITPCFRNDDEDALHKRYFMKLELFVTDATAHEDLMNLISDCATFFGKCVDEVIPRRADKSNRVVLKKYGETFDLELEGVELGSYGVRSVVHTGRVLTWLFATGLAEPRFTRAAEMAKALT